MITLKLFHNDDCIGIITNVAPEDLSEWSGDIELTDKAKEYKEVFDYLADEDNVYDDGTEMPFSEAYLDNWSLVDESGIRRTDIAYPEMLSLG